VGGASSQLLPEAVSEGQQEAHGQDPGAEPLGLLRLLLPLLLLLEQPLQESSPCTADGEHKVMSRNMQQFKRRENPVRRALEYIVSVSLWKDGTISLSEATWC